MRDYLETFFRRKWLFFVPFFAVLAAAIAFGVYSSWVYEVQARVSVQPNPMLESAGQQLSLPPSDVKDEYARLSDLLLTDDFMEQIVNSVPALKANATDATRMQAAVDKLHKDLNAWAPGSTLINFRYRDRDPQVAQQVVSKTIDLFIAQRQADRIGKANDAITFLAAQQGDYQNQLQTASTSLSDWEKAHPPDGRATLPESEQLAYQRLRTNYDTVLDHLKYVGDELEKARFTKDKMLAAQAGTYEVKDPPVVPTSPAITVNKLLSLVLLGVGVAAGLGFCLIALATWFGAGNRGATRTALPAWADRMTRQEEQSA
jgi:hypothetical protein